MEQQPRWHEFSDADRAASSDELVRHLDELGGLDFFQVLERRINTLLEARPGGRFLEVGCGTGDDVRGLAQLVGPTGLVVGVDSSATMIAEAQQRAGSGDGPVDFRVGDAHHLDFPDQSFDGCRARRVLQHVDDPARVVAEMARITRSGGRIVAFEPDWGTLFVDATDRATTRRILDLRCDSIRNGWIGRQLPRLLRGAGLADIVAEPIAYAETNSSRGMGCPGMELAVYAERARAAGMISAVEVTAWLAQLNEAGQAGRFFAGFLGVLASGRKA